MENAISSPRRDEWEIKDDVRAIKRALAVFKDPARLKDAQDMIKAERAEEKSMDLVVDGKLAEALGISTVG